MLLEREKISIKLNKLMRQFKRCYIDGEKIEIPFLVLSVGQACTLKCRDCGNFSPYAQKQNMRYDSKKIIKDVKSIIKVANINLIQIQGGEPFIYSNLERIICSIPENIKIRIATNGTVIPKENILRLLHNRNVNVRISDYKFDEKISQKISKLEDALKLFNVEYSRYNFTAGNDSWVKFSNGTSIERGGES